MLSAETKHKERRFLYVSSYHSTPHIATSKWVLLPMNFFAARSKKVSMPFSRRRNRGRLTVRQLVAGGWERLRCGIEDRDRGAPPSTVIRGRSADNRKAPLYFSFPLEGKCHIVAKGCTRVSIPMKLTIVLLGPTSADLETLCRVSTKRRISVRKASDRNAINYQSAEPPRQALPNHQPLAH